MTYNTFCRLSAIAGRNQFPLRDVLFTGAFLAGFFGATAVVLGQLF